MTASRIWHPCSSGSIRKPSSTADRQREWTLDHLSARKGAAFDAIALGRSQRTDGRHEEAMSVDNEWAVHGHPLVQIPQRDFVPVDREVGKLPWNRPKLEHDGPDVMERERRPFLEDVHHGQAGGCHHRHRHRSRPGSDGPRRRRTERLVQLDAITAPDLLRQYGSSGSENSRHLKADQPAVPVEHHMELTISRRERVAYTPPDAHTYSRQPAGSDLDIGCPPFGGNRPGRERAERSQNFTAACIDVQDRALRLGNQNACRVKI